MQIGSFDNAGSTKKRFVMMIMLSDGAAIAYILKVLLCIYGTGLFLWGLFVAREQGWHVSAVYLYMLGLFSSLGYSSVYSAISRYYSLVDPYMSHSFRDSWCWASRTVPLILALAAIVGHMTYRAFWQRFGDK